MSKLFSENAYSILGLDTSATQKDITKRSKDILHQLFMDENPEFETDISSINESLRSEASVNDAVQRLSSPVKRIQEYFFWFEVENSNDEMNLDLLRDDQYDEALDNWKDHLEKSYTAKRNIAIASSLLLNKTGYKKHLKLSLDAWKEVVESDKFWSHFEKVYALNDEIGTSSAAINEFRAKVSDYLSDFYTDVSRGKKDNSIFAAFSATFGVKGQKVQDEVLAPIFDQINSAAEQLRDLDASADGKLSSQESMTIVRLTKKIQDLFQEVKDLGLYEDSQSKAMRDKAAKAINILAVDLFDNLDQDAKATALVKVAKSIASGPAVISQINKNIETMRTVSAQVKIFQPINMLIDKEKYSEALDLIFEEREKHKKDTVLNDYFKKRIQWCVTAISVRDFNSCRDLFDRDQFEEAAGWFRGIFDFAYQYVEDFEIEASSLETVLDSLRLKLANVNASNLSDIDAYRQSVIDNSDEGIKDKDKFELTIVTILMDSLIYERLSQLIPAVKKQNKNQHAKNVAWRIVGWVIAIAVFGLIGSASHSGSNSSSTSSSSGSSAYQSCSSEYDSLKSQLDAVNTEMDGYQGNNTEAYNNLVPQQNSLTNQVNDKATECNNLR
ncbi:MAG: hypothetical protein JWN75_983 [Candidatus Saccharibacteria bacterium]|nr:hypothetical protein [Candidatus Saccharibacteria bacterium]